MEINFIPDKVLKLTDESDLLGTKPYSDTIFEIVNKCEGKKNIGLFGSWGSGKSTILTTLEDLIKERNLKGKNEKIAYFEFDAWKYSKDDFRRSFLIELNSSFKIKSQEKLLKLLYSETSVEDPKQTKFKFNWLNLPNWIILSIAFTSILFYYSPLLSDQQDLKSSIALFTLLLSLLSTAANNTINKYKVVVKQSKIIEPERFEAIFDEIINEITAKPESSTIIYKWIEKLKCKPEYSKVIVVIDNLDRCDDENLLVTLNTIKNFLEHKKVIFILPVDEKGITAFLSQKTDNADEYLRKIFHLIIRLKEFSNKELFEFTSRINKAYDLDLNPSSIRIICYEFSSNPRKIIQFLNNYQSEMKLIEEQSRMGYIDGEFIKYNLSFFIKLLIIKYEWKGLYDEILYDKNLLNKINEVITNVEPDGNGLYPINRTNVKLSDSQRNFFFGTQEIHCTKIDPFVLNIDLDKDVPDEIENLIRNSIYDEIVNYLNNDEIDFNENKLLQKINEVFSNLTYKHREYSFIALPIIKLLINFILDEKQQKFKDTLIKNQNDYTFLKSLFKDDKIGSLFDKFDFEKLTKTTKWFSDNINDDLFNSFIKHFNKTLFNPSTVIEAENEKIGIFLSTFKGSNKLNQIRKNFSNKLNSKPELSKINELKDYSLASRVINPYIFKLMAINLNNEEVDASVKHHIFMICKEYIQNNNEDDVTRKHLINYQLKELEQLYAVEKITEDVYEDYKGYFKTINTLIENSKTGIELSSTIKAILTDLNSYFYTHYNAAFDEKIHYDIYELFFDFIKNLIFYTKGFNQVSLRTTFFENYLKKNFSKKVSLKLNEILFQDVKKYSVYDYSFSETLIDFYLDSKKGGLPYAKPLIIMLEKSNRDEGLSETQINQIVLRTINLFSIYENQECISYMKRLKKSVGNKVLEILNDGTGVYTDNYVQSVKFLDDKWFYGDAVLNYLKDPLFSSNDGSYSSFKGKLGNLTKIFSIDEQIGFVKELINNSNNKVYKWLRLSFNILPKKVYDLYLENLIYAHENNLIGNNDFFEWIIEIPKEYFYKNRLKQFVNYLSGLDIKHKTYKPKKEKALEYLSKS